MADRDQRFTIAAEEIAGALNEGEALVMNLRDGSCYTLEGASAFAWELLHEGNTLGQVAAALTRTFEVHMVRAEADLLSLTEQLLEEGLLVPNNGVIPPVRTPGLAARPRPYQPLKLKKVTDLADLGPRTPAGRRGTSQIAR